MIAGFTGTQAGMSVGQKRFFTVELQVREVTELHLGDCIGADFDAWKIAKFLGIRTVGHPPSDPKKRAFCTYDEEMPPAPYLERNHHIVDASAMLFGAPRINREEPRSGTWATIRYARRVHKEVVIIER
jgi:hypothetical protein